MPNILLIDDDGNFSRTLRDALEKHGYGVECLESAEGGPDVLDTGDFDLVLLDNHLPGRTGLEFLSDLHERGLRLPVILLTGNGCARTAIEAVKQGAYAYVVKPLDYQDLLRELEPLMAKALRIDWRGEQIRLPGDAPPDGDSSPELKGNSPAMNRVYERIGRCVGSELPVLIRGETGTGKELVARAIRAHGTRKDKPFVVVACAAYTEDRLEEELFGHEAGARGGGDKLRKGSFEHADGGTLFLDEIGNLPARIQMKLLGALDHHKVYRREGEEAIKVNVRLLAATRHDLEAGLREGQFHRELFSRLNGMSIELPPLRERGPEDLRLLSHHFLAQVAQSTNRLLLPLHEGAWAKLLGYSWPGNIRELQNVLGRAALLCRGAVIVAEDIEFDERPCSGGEAAAAIRQAIEAALQADQTNLVARLHDILRQELLLLSLTKCGGDQQKAERILGVPLRSLLPQNRVAVDAGEMLGKPKDKSRLQFQTEALLLILNNPEWTAEQYAEKLECSKATLYRYEAIKRALKAKGTR